MKKKYFFGIFICLILLCSGVFLLDANSNSINYNENLINEEVSNAKTDANFHFNGVYGYDTAGVNFEVRLARVDKTGAGYDNYKSKVINYYDKATGKLGDTLDIGTFPVAHYRMVEVFVFGNLQPGLTYSHNGYYARFKGTLNCTDDMDRDIDFKFTASGASERYGETGSLSGTTLNFYIYWIVQLKLDENGGNSISNDVYYSTEASKLTTSVTKPTRTGYNFAGYYTEKNGGQQWITANGTVNTTNLNLSTARPKTLYAHWTPNQYDVNINIYSPEGNEEYTSNVNGTYTLKDENGGVFTGQYNEISGKKITFDKSWQIYNIVPGAGRSLDRVTSTGFSQSLSGNTYTFTCTGTSGLTINIYMKWSEYKIDINFYQPNGSTQEGGTFDLYKKLSGGSETLIQKGLSNEVSGQEYLQYRGQFIRKRIYY